MVSFSLKCVSAYSRQFVEQLPKPGTILIRSRTGLPPTVAIEQCKTRGLAKSAKSTVGGILTQAEGPGLAVLPHSPALSATPEGRKLPSLRRGAMM
jgi:hypothetical protein